MGLEVLYELGVETVSGERFGIADNDEFHSGACNGDIHASYVAEETDGALVVVAYHAEDDDIAFLSLETVDAVDSDLLAKGAEELLPFEEFADEAYLCPIGGDDAEVDAFVVDAGEAYHVDVVAEDVDEHAGFVGVGTAEGAAFLFGVVASGGIDPGERGVERGDETVGHFGSGVEHAVVEPLGREGHNVAVHAVLCGEEGDAFWFAFSHLLHEGEVEASMGGIDAFYSGWKLAVVAAEDDAVGFENCCPAGGLEGLCGFVDEEGGETSPVEDEVGASDEGASNYTGLIEEVLLDVDFELCGTVAKVG